MVKNIGARIRDMRHSLGLTQEGMAFELGVSTSSVQRWESGANKPSVLAVWAIERKWPEQAKVHIHTHSTTTTTR